MKKTLITIFIFTVPCLVIMDISFNGCTKVRETTPAKIGAQSENPSYSDSLYLGIYDSLGWGVELVKRFTHKVTPADYELFRKEAYIEYYKAKKAWYSWRYK